MMKFKDIFPTVRILEFIVGIMVILALLIGLGGCARTTSDEDYSVLIQGGFKGFTQMTLMLSNKFQPTTLPAITSNFQFAADKISELAQSDSVSVESISETLVTLFNHINSQTSGFPPDIATLVSSGIQIVATMFNSYFKPVTIPEQVQKYANAVAQGIRDGIEAFEQASMVTSGKQVKMPAVVYYVDSNGLIGWR